LSVLFLPLVVGPLLLPLAGCSPGTQEKSKGAGLAGRKLRYPVVVRKVETFPVEYAVNAVGSVEAFEKVEVVARVSGVLDKLAFEEGSRVTTQQILAQIEPERYQLAVAAAKASLQRAEAAQAEADAAFERRRKLLQKAPGTLTAEEVSTAIAKVHILAAETAQARAALNMAERDLREAYVRSPVDGVIQTRQAQTGQFVQRGATIATLLRRDPLLLRFNVPAVDIAKLKTGMGVRFTVAGFVQTFRATIFHVAEQAESSSRMVTITARVLGPDREVLKPGTFAEVTVPIDSDAENPIILQAAVRPSERGFLAFVVENGVARERILKLGLRTADGQVEIRSGLTPGEILIVQGSDALRDGAEVDIEKKGKSSSRASEPGTSSTTAAKTEKALRP